MEGLVFMPFGRYLLHNYDLAIIEYLGGHLNVVDDENFKRVEGVTMYTVPVDGIVNVYSGHGRDVRSVESNLAGMENEVPVYVSYGEPVYNQYKVPSFVLHRITINNAFDVAPWYEYKGRLADDAQQISVEIPLMPDEIEHCKPIGSGTKVVQGWDKWEYRARGEPVRIDYELRCYARTQRELQIMMYYVMRRFYTPSFHFPVRAWTDDESRSEVNTYTAVDVVYSDMSELTDIVQSTPGFVVSFTVLGELDIFADKVAEDIITEVRERTEIINDD